MSDNSLQLIWGVPAIAKATGRSERAIYHVLERAKAGEGPGLPGVKKIAGKWCFDPQVFRAAMREPGPMLASA
jgi:hypothetical protein